MLSSRPFASRRARAFNPVAEIAIAWRAISSSVRVTGMVEVLFTNVDFLQNHSDIKGRVAPGALVYSFAEGLLVQATMQHTGYAFLNMELNIEGPVFADDTIHVECEVIEARLTRSRPGRGPVRTTQSRGQAGRKLALIYTPLRMVKCRDPDALA